MSKQKILVQLDTDSQPSVFDSVVAVDAGVEQLFRHASMTPENVVPAVHGAIFTRGVDDLKSTALFVGGSDVSAGEALLKAITKAFFGPMRVSVMLDSNGANTTAAAAVLAARKHLTLAGAQALVLGATGPVGQRVVRLLAREKASVRVGSRSESRAQQVCQAVGEKFADAELRPVATSTPEETSAALAGVQLVIAAGAAGTQLLSKVAWTASKDLAVAIDLNAVPPEGIEGVAVTDAGKQHEHVVCYGAIGVGGTKMKIHKAAIAQLFQRNDQVLDAEEIFQLGLDLP